MGTLTSSAASSGGYCSLPTTLHQAILSLNLFLPVKMKEYECLTEQVRQFVVKQHVFFVATSPCGRHGHVNVSPKGLTGTLVFIDEELYCQVASSQGIPLLPESKCFLAYLDTGGSGIETCAHLQENGRITLMFAAFEGPPKIIRMFGRG